MVMLAVESKAEYCMAMALVNACANDTGASVVCFMFVFDNLRKKASCIPSIPYTEMT